MNVKISIRRYDPDTDSEPRWDEYTVPSGDRTTVLETLAYVYENQLKVIPSFAILSIYGFFTDFMTTSGVNLAGIVHGEHELILHSPIPPDGGTLTSEGQITAMYDKGAGKGALVIGEVDTYHSDGQKLYTNVVTLFSRLDGGSG